jgi:MinD-like ATPase involved in chromosome partitioning or flagellar assembly
VSPYPPLPDDELGSGPGGPAANGGSGYGASPYPTYTPYGPDEEIADDALTDYGLPSPQSYGYAPPPPQAEPLPDLGVPEPRFGAPGAAYRPNGTQSEERDWRDEPGPRDDQGRPDDRDPRDDRGRPGDRGLRVQQDDWDDQELGDEREWSDRDEPGPAAEAPPVAAYRPAAEARPAPPDSLAPPADDEALPVPGFDRHAGGHRRDAGGPGQHRVTSTDAELRGAPPAGPNPAGTAPPRNPAAAPPLGRPVPAPAPARPQPGYPGGYPAGPGGLGGPPRPPHDDFGPEPDADAAHETSDSLTAEALLQGKRTAPGSGWRRTVYKATGGLVRVGESTAMQRRRELVWRARTPVAGGHHRVAVMSLKGGVGKTTTTVGLGATLATLRGDRVIAVDANPDRGTLSDKVRLETSATVRDLLNERRQVRRYADVRAFTSQASSRLEVLASDRDPGVSVAFSEADYCDVARVLEHYYSICITDCGTGLLHSAMAGVLGLADQIVLVSSPSVDGARSASATLDWLDAHDYSDLVRNAVVVLSTVRPRSKSTVDLDRLEQHFAARCRDVVRVPYDPHLEEGAEVELEQLSPATTEAYLRLAATVGDGFAWPRRSLNRTGMAGGV